MESVGFTRQQAEKMAEEQGKLIDERLATKEDIAVINGNIEGFTHRDEGRYRVLFALLPRKT